MDSSWEFEDSIESEDYSPRYSKDFSLSSEAVPLKVNIVLNDIWLPSQLFNVEDKAEISKVRNVVTHTLQKAKNVESFSVYCEEDLKERVRVHLIDSLLLRSPKHFTSNGCSEFSSNVANSELILENPNNETKNERQKEEEIIDNFPVNNSENVEKNQANSNSNNEADEQKISRDILDLLEFDDNESDVSLTNSITDIPDSLNDIFSGAGNGNVLTTVERIKNETVDLSDTEEEENLSINSNRFVYSDAHSKKSLNQIDLSSQKSEPELQVEESELQVQEPEPELVDLPFAYQRPVLEEKPKEKVKKLKKNNQKKTLLLTDFSDSNYKAPENNDFFKDVMLKENQKRSLTKYEEFPTLNLPKSKPNSTSAAYSDVLTKAFWETVMPPSDNEQNHAEDSESVEDSVPTDGPLTATIVIENIPICAHKDDVESLALSYSEFKKLSLVRHGKYQKAFVEVDFDSDLDWIECLNGTEPFGASSDLPIKCYKFC